MSGMPSKKNVRFPEEQQLSQSREATPLSDEEPDYFNLRPAEDEDDDDESDSDIRAQTRSNTLQNRQRPYVPGFSVTPPPEQALEQRGHHHHLHLPGLGHHETAGHHGGHGGHNLNLGAFEGLSELGNAGGLAPGAQEHADVDPFADELATRRQRLLSTLTPEQRRMAERTFHSQPASPGLETPGSGNDSAQGDHDHGHGAIPLKTLVSGVEERLEQLQHDRQRDQQLQHDRQHDRRRDHHEESSSDKTLNDEKAPDEKQDGKEDGTQLEEQKSPDTTRVQAEEIARQLVQAHGIHTSNRNTTTDGFVENPGFLEKAAELDNDAEVPPEDSEGKENPNAMEMEVGGRLGDEELPPERVREGILGSLLRLYAERDADMKSQASLATSGSGYTPLTTPGGSPAQSPSATPPTLSRASSSRDSVPTMATLKKKGGLKPPTFMRTHSTEDVLGRSTKDRRQWYDKHSKSKSSASAGFAALAANSVVPGAAVSAPGTPGGSGDGTGVTTPTGKKDKKDKKKKSMLALPMPHEHYAKQAAKRKRKAQLEAEQARITIHIADLLQRQRFILRFGRALMLFGAPSHRLEEYLRVTARTLEIDAQFLYMPGCMLVSFGDATTHTSETKLLKVPQGLNLTKLDATHLVFKEVVHGLMEIEEAGQHIDALLQGKNQYPPWMTILFFGLATGFLCLFAFNGYWTDLPIAMALGWLVGFLQIWVAPRSDLYANVFEVSASVLISFIGRAMGSIRPSAPIFCFGAIVQGALALILPGYIILCGSLELQSKNLVAGAVRMFYAIIYSTFLAFGITLGSAIYGWIDGSAVSKTTCTTFTAIDQRYKILFVPLSAMFMSLVNQANLRQLPTMVIIASAGYTVLYFVQTKIANASAFTSALGALTIGLLGNLYSRVGHGLAFAAMLPGIFVIVPSGVAVQGSLISGLSLAETITQKNGSTTTTTSAPTNSSVTDLGGTMTQVAVGITVGLFVATLAVYPLGTGTKRSGLFTF